MLAAHEGNGMDHLFGDVVDRIGVNERRFVEHSQQICPESFQELGGLALLLNSQKVAYRLR